MENEEIQEQHQFEALIQGLIDDDYGCCTDFILPDTILGLRKNIETITELGKMKPSGIGSSENFQLDKSIRGDKINWISDLSTNPFEVIYLQKLKKFIHHLNATCFTSIGTYESHYATYPIGSFYKRHIDQFKTEKGRKFSVVLYLNDQWDHADGGQLSLYPVDKPALSIIPLGGQLVFFRSDEMEHEVLPSFTKERHSIAGWLKD